MRAAACSWFQIDLDPVAMLRDRWSTDELLSRLGASIGHVRAKDAVLGADRRTKPIAVGRGSVTWDELLMALQNSDYSDWLTVDPIDLPDRRSATLIALNVLRGKKTSPP